MYMYICVETVKLGDYQQGIHGLYSSPDTAYAEGQSLIKSERL